MNLLINNTKNNTKNFNSTDKELINLENDEFNSFVKVMPLNINVTEKILFYDFLKTISTGYYIGNWTNLKVKKNRFTEIEGEGDIDFNIKKEKNFLLNLGQPQDISKVNVEINIKDGKYINDYITVKFMLLLDNITVINIKNESINIMMPNSSISYRWNKFIFPGKYINVNNTFINITFFKYFKLYENYIDYSVANNKYGKIFFEIKSTSLNESNSNKSYSQYFEISFKGNGFRYTKYSHDLLNYSIYITIIIITEILLFSKFRKSIQIHDQIALNINILTALKHLLWTSLLAVMHLYIYFIVLKVEQEFYMVGFCFFEYSIDLISTIYILLDVRHISKFSKIIFFICYTSILIISIYFIFFIKLWFLDFILLYIFVMTWTEQIIYSTKKVIKPPMPYLLILSISFSKMNIIWYIKAYKNNIFELRPNLNSVIYIWCYIIVETIIICLQKYFGAQFFVPKKFKKKLYNYYREEEELSENDKEIECSICLEKIGNIPIDNEEEIKILKGNCFKKNINKLIERIKNIKKNSGNYMVTPCNHYFHSICLEPWLNVSNKCPTCRTNLPPLSNDN